MVSPLGLGVVQMSCPEEVEHIFSAQQLFEVKGKHLVIWEPQTQLTDRI